jgi:hypothetical protein
LACSDRRAFDEIWQEHHFNAYPPVDWPVEGVPSLKAATLWQARQNISQLEGNLTRLPLIAYLEWELFKVRGCLISTTHLSYYQIGEDAIETQMSAVVKNVCAWLGPHRLV